MSLETRMEFVNFWYIMIVINDLMTIVGSGIKIRIENKVLSVPLMHDSTLFFSQESAEYEVCGVLLGTGNLLVWFGVLRYLGFFGKYNVGPEDAFVSFTPLCN